MYFVGGLFSPKLDRFAKYGIYHNKVERTKFSDSVFFFVKYAEQKGTQNI